ncbi:MAG: hypothetical protein H0X62_13470 [Bacteroidetes bacterium]|nr:hypothetical protein [Bacteroidota bacterium]
MKKVFIAIIISITGFLIPSCTLDVCKHVKCENSGYCNEGFCECPPGFSGEECEIRENFRLIIMNPTLLVSQGKSNITSIFVTSSNGNPKVKFSIKGLHEEGLSAEFSPEEDNLMTLLTIRATSSVEMGTYECLLTGITENGIYNEFPITIIVTDCVPLLMGEYDAVEYRGGTGDVYEYKAKLELSNNNILISRFWLNENILITLKCDEYRLIIPEQNSGGETIKGIGSYDSDFDYIEIEYTSSLGSSAHSIILYHK